MAGAFAISAYFLVLTTNVTVSITNSPGSLDWHLEPNDSPEEAAAIEFGSLENLGACGNTDWYRVTVPAGDVLDVRATWEAADGSIALRLADLAGQTIQVADLLPGRPLPAPLPPRSSHF